MAVPSSTQDETLHRDLIDPVSFEPLTDAVTVIPCGHVLSEKTVQTLQERNLPCPLDQTPIKDFIENYQVRNVVINLLEKEPTEEAIALLEQGKMLVNAEKYQQAIDLFFRALNISPQFEKARNFLEFCLNMNPQAAPASSEAPRPSTPPPAPNFENLTQAAREGDVDMLKKLVAQGVDVNMREENKLTALEWAAKEGQVDAVRYLLSQNALVDPGHLSKWTAMHAAASEDQAEVLKLFLLKGYDPNGQTKYLQTPLHIAAHHGHLAAVKQLVAKDATVDIEDRFGATPLHNAAAQGHLEVVEFLLSKKAKFDAQKKNGFTSLELAIGANHIDVAQALIKRGADVNAPNGNGDTPLHVAAEEGSVKKIEALIELGANVNAENKKARQAPLHRALEKRNTAAAQALLEHLADPNLKVADGRSPLLTTLRTRSTKNKQAYVDGIQLLLKFKADINEIHQGRTPLLTALLRDLEEEAILLINSNADYNLSPTPLGFKALGLAISRKCFQAAILLLDKEANPEEETSLNTKDKPIHKAAEQNSVDVAEVLKSKNADLAARGENEQTPLHAAASHGSLDMIRWLLANNADPTVTDKDGSTPMEVAIKCSKIEAAQILLGANPAQPTQTRTVTSIDIFGANEWNKLKFDFQPSNIIPQPKNLEEILNSPSPFWDDKSVGETSRVYYLPPTINGRPLNRGFLDSCANSSFEGIFFGGSYPTLKLEQQFGNVQINKPRWVLITQGPVIPSLFTGATFHDQKNMIGKINRKSTIKYNFPDLIDLVTIGALEHMQGREDAISGSFFCIEEHKHVRLMATIGKRITIDGISNQQANSYGVILTAVLE